MEYSVLGPLEVRRDGQPIAIGPYRHRLLLALFLTRPNSVFSTDQIIDSLWDDPGATDKQNSLWVFISGLRKVLEPEREKRTDGSVLLTRSPGYLLSTPEDEVDALRFEKLLAEGRALAASEPGAASMVLGEALSLWRGKAYEDFTYESAFQSEIARLSELRLEAVETRIEADLARGLAGELVSELDSLCREHPLRERLSGQLMLALYRSGRQADALRVYTKLSGRLAEELGLEPTMALRQLEQQIIVGDHALDSPVAAGTGGKDAHTGLSIRGYELREKIGEGAYGVVYRAYQPAVGREVAIKVIRPELADDAAFIRLFEAEAKHVAHLEHPHIVPLYDFWREPGAAYLVQRLFTGGSLESIMETTALHPREAVKIADQLTQALTTAHREEIVHRDIKPANILLDSERNAYLADFGIALGPDSSDSHNEKRRATRTAPYASPELLLDGHATAATDVYGLAVVLAQTLTGMRGDIEQIRGALDPDVAAVIERATSPRPDERFADATAFFDAFRESIGFEAPEQPDADLDVQNPYKGLRAFDDTDAREFYGRERVIDRLLYRLSEPGTRGRFVALVGPSGSGKSSVVKAGLRPALAKGALTQSDRWFVAEMTPAPHPFEQLETALRSIAIDPPTSLLLELTASASGLRSLAAQVLPEDETQLLLIIDQFEELFTQIDEDTATRFLDALVDAASHPHSRVRVVLTLRADFYDRPLRHVSFGELMRDGTEAITPMNAAELERAITGPAESIGVRFDPALVASVVSDVVGRPSALPLMQYTLTELFDGRSGNVIPASAYDELGGVSGALVHRAEGLLSALSPSAQDAARQVFLRLVSLGEGTDDTRRRVLLSELEHLHTQPGDIGAVLDAFGRHRLLSFDRDPITRSPTVEIAHEALLTEWNRFHDWIEESRDDVRQQRRLNEAMSEWVVAGRDQAYLLHGGRLDQLQIWDATSTLPLSAPEQSFLDASVAERDRLAAEEQNRETRTHEAEVKAAKRNRLIAALGVITLVVGALAVYGFVQQRSASQATRERDSLLEATDLASRSTAALSTDTELALLLAIESVRSTADLGFAIEESVDALHWAIQEGRLTYDVTEDTPVAVRPGPSGPTGVWVLPPAQLVAFAEDSVGRALTADECATFFGGSCPEHADLPEDLPLRRGVEAYGAAPLTVDALAGTRISYLGEDFEGVAIVQEFAAFTERTGIDIALENAGFEADLLNSRILNNEPLPDVVTYVGANVFEVADFAIDLRTYLDPQMLRSDFTATLMNLATVGPDGTSPADDGAIYSIPIDLDIKGLVFYVPTAFEQAGYEVPQSLDQLLDLSEQIVADGGTPWCFAFNSPSVSAGWPGTDIVESLAARFGGVETYDDWMTHRIPFDNDAVAAAGAYLDRLIFTDGFVRNGPESISATDWTETNLPLLRKDATGRADPDCWMTHQFDVMFALTPNDTQIGTDLGAFILPPANEGEVAPLTGGSSYAATLSDRPEVRIFTSWMASPEFGRVQAATSAVGNYVSPNARFDSSIYGQPADPTVTPEEISIRLSLATSVQQALAADRFLVDASDFMPDLIGGLPPEGSAFMKGMLDYVDGVRTFDQMTADVEADWVALDNGG